MEVRKRNLANSKQNDMTSKENGSFKEFTQHSTIHGLYELVFEKSVAVRVVWLLVFVFAVAMLIYETTNITRTYISQPTVSHITTTVPRYFPEVIYCPSTFVDPIKSETLGFDRDVYRYYKSLYTWISFFEAYYFDLMFDNMDAKDFFKTGIPDVQRMGYKFMTFLKTHRIANFTELTKLVCYDEKDVITIPKQAHIPNVTVTKLHLLNSICYKVQDHTRYTEMEITHINLQFAINDIQRMFPPYDEHDVMYIGNEMGVAPFGALSITPSFDESISITAMNFKRQNLKRRNCRADWNYADRDRCTMDCLNKEMCKKMANCTFPVPWDDSISGLCSLYSPVSCIGESTKKKNVEERQFLFEKCYSDCPKPCEMWLYQAVVTPTKRAGNKTKSLFRIKFADPSNSMQVIEVLTESWSTLLSSIGGTFSLWIGASLISFVQLSSFLFSQLMSSKTRSTDADNIEATKTVTGDPARSPFD